MEIQITTTGRRFVTTALVVRYKLSRIDAMALKRKLIVDVDDAVAAKLIDEGLATIFQRLGPPPDEKKATTKQSLRTLNLGSTTKIKESN